MTYHRPWLLAVLLVGGLAATASPAWAAELIDDDALKVDLSALAEVGLSWRGSDQAAAQSSARTRLRMARAGVKGTWRDRGALKLSVEGSSGAVALGYHDEHLHLLAEALVSLDSPDEAATAWAAHASAGYRVDVESVEVEPALAYDVIDAHHELVHRGALALNTYWLGTDIMTTAEYEVEVPDHEVVHTVSVLLQLGF